MSGPSSNKQSFTKKHKFMLQSIAFVMIIVLPYFLYLAAQAQLEIVVNTLLGFMTLMMLFIIQIS